MDPDLPSGAILDFHCNRKIPNFLRQTFCYYSSPSILQPCILHVLRPPLIIRLLDLVPKGNILTIMTIILRPPAI